jgi:FkbM family methyltransferase
MKMLASCCSVEKKDHRTNMAKHINDHQDDMVITGPDGVPRQSYTKLKERMGFHKACGFHPKVIYDIGAHVGHYSRTLQSIFPEAQFHLFEANPTLKSLLHDWEHHNMVLLGDKDFELKPFYKAKDYPLTTGNSMFRENSSFYDSETKVVTEMLCQMSLDTFTQMHHLPLPDFIKLDVQGAELLVLQGALRTLQTCPVVQMEVSLHSLNEGAPLLAEILPFMTQLGYQVIDTLEVIYTRNFNTQLDLLFARDLPGLQYHHS